MKISKWQNLVLYLFAFSIIFENMSIAEMDFIDYSIPKLIGIMFIIISLFNIKSILDWAPLKQYLIPLIFFFIIIIISFIINYDHDFSSMFIINTILQNILFFMFILSIIRKRPDVGFKMFLSLNIGMLVSTVLYLFKIGLEYTDGRLSIFGENGNMIGVFSVLCIMFILSLIIENKQKLSAKRYWLALLLFPLLKIVADTGSRMTFIGLMLSLFIFFIFQKGGKQLNRVIIGLSGIILILLSFNYLMNTGVLHERMLRTIQTHDLSGRDLIWLTTIQEIIKNPVFGIGPNGYTKLSTLYFTGKFFSPHNVFIEILAYCGFAGLLAFVVFYYRILKTAIQTYQRLFWILPSVLLIFTFFVFFSGQGLATKPFWLIYAYVVSTKYNHESNVFERSYSHSA